MYPNLLSTSACHRPLLLPISGHRRGSPYEMQWLEFTNEIHTNTQTGYVENALLLGFLTTFDTDAYCELLAMPSSRNLDSLNLSWIVYFFSFKQQYMFFVLLMLVLCDGTCRVSRVTVHGKLVITNLHQKPSWWYLILYSPFAHESFSYRKIEFPTASQLLQQGPNTISNWCLSLVLLNINTRKLLISTVL